MPKYSLVKKATYKTQFKCQMCGDSKYQHAYEYKPLSYVQGYIPEHMKEVCGDCVYRECYGSKKWRKKKKEGVLDED